MNESVPKVSSFPEGPRLAHDALLYAGVVRSFIEKKRTQKRPTDSMLRSNVVKLDTARNTTKQVLDNLEGKCKRLEEFAGRLMQTPKDQKILSEVRDRYESLMQESKVVMDAFVDLSWKDEEKDI
jgi:hypothetical protein